MTLQPGGPPPSLFPDILRSRAEMDPHRVALVVDGSGSLTFSGWDQKSNAFARGLKARGIRPSERVGLLFAGDSWLDYAVAFFGTLKAGAVAVPISTASPMAQIERILHHSEAVAVCCRHGTPNAPRSLPVWHPADIVSGQETGAFQAVVDPDALGQILYTSGTTGVAKGVACSHANLLFGIVTDDDDLVVARRERVALHALPIGVNAAQLELTRAAHRMAKTVILPTFDPERFAALISDHQASVLLLIPATAIMMMNAGSFGRHDVSSVRRLRLTGAASPPALLRRLADALPGVEITNEYALTESAPIAITSTYDPARADAVGRPGPGQLLRIVGPGGEDCPAGRVGEVWLGGPGVPLRSYYGEPQATAAVFGGGWLRTGDVGYLDEDGFLHLTDRESDVIMTGGRKVCSLEVEAVLHDCPAVAEAAVVGVPHEILGEYVAAIAALRTPITAAQIKEFVRRQVPEHAVPQTVLFVDALPRGISGKVLKIELRERIAQDATAAFVAPRDDIERGIAGIWSRVLGVEAVSVNDRFVELGGQSLSALQVLADIERRYGVLLNPRELAEAETVAALAAVVTRRGASEQEADVGPGNVRSIIERRGATSG